MNKRKLTPIFPNGKTMPFRDAPPSQAVLDHLEAHERAIQERTPSDVYEEWLRLVEAMESIEGTDRLLSKADEARLFEIINQYDRPASAEDMARHIGDIVREREHGTVRKIRLLSDKIGPTER